MKAKLWKWCKTYYWLILSIIIGFAFFNISYYFTIIRNFLFNFNNGMYFQRYVESNANILQRIILHLEFYWNQLKTFIIEINWKIIGKKLLRFMLVDLMNLLNIAINILVIVFLLNRIYLSKVSFKAKTTKSAKLGIKIVFFLKKIKKLWIKLVSILKKNKKKIKISFFIIGFLHGFLLSLLLEMLLFVFYYAIGAVKLELHLFILSIFQSVIIFMYLCVPVWLQLILLIITFFYISKMLANKLLDRNLNSLKVIEKYELSFINIIFGPPGVGKTRLLVNLALACNENFINQLEELLKEIEIEHPGINYGEVIEDKYRHVKDFPKHYYYYRLLHQKKSNIASAPFGIIDPYADDLSVRLDFDFIRPNKFADVVPLEEFKILALSELDKEYNSHYSKKEVGEDGTHLFFGTASHWMKRNGKVYVDYQQPTQVPLNIRGNAESFIRIKDVKMKYPFMLKIYRFPWKMLYKILYKAIDLYENFQERLGKNTRRTGKKIRKRYDYTLLYGFFRYSLYVVNKIKKYFDRWNFLAFNVNLEDVNGEVIKELKLKVNNQDEHWKEQRLYDSTFLSRGYDDKYKASKKKWKDLSTWSSVTPKSKELKEIHSRFINKAFFDFDNVDVATENTNLKQESSTSDSELEELRF
ncbi:hypothetical protein ACAG96_04505 [Candidatus Izemoplasma sp. B36]|uniref:hypothetical protein n=1 Tax=Candidatus Izemoplasma sp. B36 TaxID=3242468 RepID=UPI00355612FA